MTLKKLTVSFGEKTWRKVGILKEGVGHLSVRDTDDKLLDKWDANRIGHKIMVLQGGWKKDRNNNNNNHDHPLATPKNFPILPQLVKHQSFSFVF